MEKAQEKPFVSETSPWLYVVLFVCILFLALMATINFSSPSPENFSKTIVEVDDILDYVDNGDLLLFTGNTMMEKMVRWHTSTPFSHVAMVVKEKSGTKKSGEPKYKLFLWEADLGQGYKAGPRVIPLKTKLKRYGGLRIGGWRKLDESKVTRPTSEQIMQASDKYFGSKSAPYELEQNYLKWFLGFKPDGRTSRKIFCSELVQLTLEDLGMLKPTKLDVFPESVGKELYKPTVFFGF